MPLMHHKLIHLDYLLDPGIQSKPPEELEIAQNKDL